MLVHLHYGTTHDILSCWFGVGRSTFATCDQRGTASARRGGAWQPNVRLWIRVDVIDHIGASGRTGIVDEIEIPVRSAGEQPFFLAVFVALAHLPPGPIYDRKIAQGKHHTQALLCLVRRWVDVLFAMLRDGTFCEPSTAAIT